MTSFDNLIEETIFSAEEFEAFKEQVPGLALYFRTYNGYYDRGYDTVGTHYGDYVVGDTTIEPLTKDEFDNSELSGPRHPRKHGRELRHRDISAPMLIKAWQKSSSIAQVFENLVLMNANLGEQRKVILRNGNTPSKKLYVPAELPEFLYRSADAVDPSNGDKLWLMYATVRDFGVITFTDVNNSLQQSIWGLPGWVIDRNVNYLLRRVQKFREKYGVNLKEIHYDNTTGWDTYGQMLRDVANSALLDEEKRIFDQKSA